MQMSRDKVLRIFNMNTIDLPLFTQFFFFFFYWKFTQFFCSLKLDITLCFRKKKDRRWVIVTLEQILTHSKDKFTHQHTHTHTHINISVIVIISSLSTSFLFPSSLIIGKIFARVIPSLINWEEHREYFYAPLMRFLYCIYVLENAFLSRSVLKNKKKNKKKSIAWLYLRQLCLNAIQLTKMNDLYLEGRFTGRSWLRWNVQDVFLKCSTLTNDLFEKCMESIFLSWL